jgi:hypothetical protein
MGSKHLSVNGTLALVQHYADREGMDYDEAEVLLLEEAGCHDNVEDFLDEVGFEMDYAFDARHLMQRAQEE